MNTIKANKQGDFRVLIIIITVLTSQYVFTNSNEKMESEIRAKIERENTIKEENKRDVSSEVISERK